MSICHVRSPLRQNTKSKNRNNSATSPGARLTKTEALAQELRAILAYATSQVELERLLKEKGFTFYERGKHCGVRPIPGEGETKARKAYRFATLGIEAEHADFMERVAPVIEPEPETQEDIRAEQSAAGEKEKAPEGAQRQEEVQAEPEPASQQDVQAQAARDTQDAFRQEMVERRAKQAEKDRTDAKTQSRGPRRRKR